MDEGEFQLQRGRPRDDGRWVGESEERGAVKEVEEGNEKGEEAGVADASSATNQAHAHTAPSAEPEREDSLRALWIHCEHTRDSHTNKDKILDSFNTESSSLQVLIIMVDVSSQGLNLQRAANRVISIIPAKRSNPQTQAETRVLRADQEHSVEIHQTSLQNFYDQFREARQISNMRLEIATKAHLPDCGKDW